MRDDRAVSDTGHDADDGPSVSRLAGQLEYLFEEHPELRHASVAELVARLNTEDRWARAITRYPNRSDAEVHSHLAEFHDRIGAVDVEHARQLVLDRTEEPE